MGTQKVVNKCYTYIYKYVVSIRPEIASQRMTKIEVIFSGTAKIKAHASRLQVQNAS